MKLAQYKNLCFLFQVSRDASHSPTAFMMDLDEMPRFQTKTSDTLTMTPAGHFHQRFVHSNMTTVIFKDFGVSILMESFA